MEKDNDDIVIEDDEDRVASTGFDKKLRERIKQAETKAKEYLDSWQRAQADFANLRRRDEEAKLDFIKFAKLTLLEELIPVLDSFNIALSHPSTGSATSTSSGQASSPQASSGQEANIKPIYKQFLSILQASGLEEIEPKGETFSPHEHEAIGVVETEKEEENHKILEVLQKGYKLNGRVIRPAKVRVGEFKS